MSKTNQNLKSRFIQTLEQFFELRFAITSLIGNQVLHIAGLQVFQSSHLSVREQQVETWLEIEVEVKD